MKQGVATTQNLHTFHIVFYIDVDSKTAHRTLSSSVNIKAENSLAALLEFVNLHPDKLDDIIYVTNLEKCKL